MEDKIRCTWAGNLAIYKDYHDNEWGRPIHDDQLLFEFLILESFQAGLSWITVLKKRENFRNAFNQFDATKIAKYDEVNILLLMLDKGIIRNRLKITATITNAQAYLEIIEKEGSFSDYLWSFVGGKVKVNHWKSHSEVPATSPESDAMSKDLKKRGFKFVGSTICYAFMQAAGLVNDHVTTCFRYGVK